MNKNKKATYVPASTLKKGSPLASNEAKVNLLKRKKWTISVVSVLTAIVMASSLFLALYQAPTKEELENKAPKAPFEAGTINNGNFDFSVAESIFYQYPYLPKDFTSTKENNRDSVSGVIDTDETLYNGKVKNSLKVNGLTDEQLVNPSTPKDISFSEDDKYVETNRVLMISNKVSTYNSYLSKSFSLSSGKYTKLSVWVNANVTEGDGAYIRLKKSSSSSAKIESQFTVKNTGGNWSNYIFYIQSSKSTSTSLYLEIGLGEKESKSTGLVYFDYCMAEDTTLGTYIENKNAIENATATANIKTFTLDEVIDKDVNLFLDSYKPNTADALTHTEYKALNGTDSKLPFYDVDSSKKSIYYIDNTVTPANSKGIQFNAMSNLFNYPAVPDCYRVSFWIKTSGLPQGTGAHLYMTEVNPVLGADKSTYIGPVSTPTDVSKDTFDGWVEYSFYIQPSNLKDYSFQIELYLGMKTSNPGQTTKPVGKLYATEFEINKVTRSAYDSATSDTSKKIDLTESTTNTLNNGSFDQITTNENGVYPLSPKNWTIAVAGQISDGGNGSLVPNTKNDIAFGVINKNNVTNGKETLGLTAGDFHIDSSNENVYVIKHKTKTATAITSNKFALAANSYSKISVIVKTKDGARANVYLTGDTDLNKENEKDKLYFKNISSAIGDDNYFTDSSSVENKGNGFYQYNFYVKTGDFEKNVQLELWQGDRDATVETLETKGSVGTVIFDYASVSTIDQAQFDKVVLDDTIFTRTELKTDTENTDKVTDVTLVASKANVVARDYSSLDIEPEVEEEEEEEEEEVPSDDNIAPISWELITAIIFAAASLLLVGIVIARKFKRATKPEAPENNYKRKDK